MPVVLTFDLQGATPLQRNRIQSLFERLQWQKLGGSAYRYPRLDSPQPVEDWFNHVIPALMLFRTFVRNSGCPLTRFSLDAQSSTGMNPTAYLENAPAAGADVRVERPTNQAFGLQQLQNWLDGIIYPYP